MGRLGAATGFAIALLTATSTRAAVLPNEVILISTGEVIAYQEAVEEFAQSCRVRFRKVTLERLPATSISAATILVTVGQESLDAVLAHLDRTTAPDEAPPRLVPLLAFSIPARDSIAGPRATPDADVTLRALSNLGPKLKRVGIVYGPRSKARLDRAGEMATQQGLTLDAVEVQNGPEAIRALAQMAKRVHALWLLYDSDVVTPQVFQFALRLQLEAGLPLLAATRQQVHAGALLAFDYSPRAAGRAAADLVNGLLEGYRPTKAELQLHEGARFTVSARTARNLGVDLRRLTELGARVE